MAPVERLWKRKKLYNDDCSQCSMGSWGYQEQCIADDSQRRGAPLTNFQLGEESICREEQATRKENRGFISIIMSKGVVNDERRIDRGGDKPRKLIFWTLYNGELIHPIELYSFSSVTFFMAHRLSEALLPASAHSFF